MRRNSIVWVSLLALVGLSTRQISAQGYDGGRAVVATLQAANPLEAPPRTDVGYNYDPAATPFDSAIAHGLAEADGHATGSQHSSDNGSAHEGHTGHHAHGGHGSHGAHGSHGGHGHGGHGHHGWHHFHDPEAHHEEEYGRLIVMPYFRDFTSDLWDDSFEAMVGFNLGTTFWTEWKPSLISDRQRVGLIAEFNYGFMEGEDNTQLNATNVNPFERNFLIQRVDHAELYAGSLGLAFENTWQIPGYCERFDLGFAPVLTIGSLNSDLEPVPFSPRDRQIFLREDPSDNGTLVNLDLRVWAGLTFENDVKLGVTGFYGFGETDAVFGRSEKINSFGAGAYLDIPTTWVPKHVPLPVGSLQWIEYLFHLE